ncbi:MAG TPA: hypothetical protein VIF62_29000, partial [Labilithrix sp.]
MRTSLLVVASMLVSVPAAAQESDRPPDTPKIAPADSLRASGRVVLDDVIGGGLAPLSFTIGWINVQSSTQESLGLKSTSTLLGFAPSADVFVYDGISIGGAISVSRMTQKSESSTPGMPTASAESTTTARSIAPRVGYAFRLSDDLLFWPRIHVAYGTSDTTNGDGAAGAVGGIGVIGTYAGPSASSSGEMWSVGGDASLVFALGRHAALAAGPYVAYAFQKQDDPHQTASSFDISMRGS